MSEDGDEPFEFEKKVICVHASRDALKVTPIHPHRPIPFWVPKECVHDDSEVFEKGGEGKLMVKKSYADRQGWT